MSTFCAVDDAALVALIERAQRRIVFISPGLHMPVAEALGRRLKEIGQIEITVILDADEDVCRIGFGEIKALQKVSELAKLECFYLRSQPGLRVGVLLADDQTLVWSPTARSVEAPPTSTPDRQATDDLFEPVTSAAPNGLLLGSNPGEQIARAVSAEGTQTGPHDAEIGTAAITPDQVAATATALDNNPPIPVDLARVTRVFSTKLQFVELKVTRAKLSQMQFSVSSALLNADAKDALRDLIESKIKAFADLRDVEVQAPLYVNGEIAYDGRQNPMFEFVSEASLEGERRALERRYIYDIAGFGRLIERGERIEFEKRIGAYKERLLAHSDEIRKQLNKQTDQIVADAVALVADRMRRSAGTTHRINEQALRDELSKNLTRVKGEAPSISLVFKDVTYEQTQTQDFRDKVNKALPSHVRRRLGPWYERFTAARSTTEKGSS